MREISEQIDDREDQFIFDTTLSDSSSKSSHSKKLLSDRTLSSSTPQTSAVAISKPSNRTSGSGRRKMPTENSLAQSVPNFSELRRDNTKSLTGFSHSKISARAQPRNTRNKGVSEENNPDKEEKPHSHRSQSLRKSSAGPLGFKDYSTVESDDASLMPLKVSQERAEDSLVPKAVRPRPFLKKGSGAGSGAGTFVAKLKAPSASENITDKEINQVENLSSRVKEDGEEFDVISVEQASRTDNERKGLISGSVLTGDQETENAESFSQRQDVSVAVLTAASSNLNSSVISMQDSPAESPVSWNSHLHHSFSYTQETSDLDASADSPTGSSASWKSHQLNQMMDNDAYRTRKKWGIAQNPVVVANAPHQSKKDVAKGFKRLLKFGRKSKGNDNIITDWVSASTNSEGDDDTEDGNDSVKRISDDMRKSRMGFPQYHSAYDGFTDGQALHSSIPMPPANFKLSDDHLSGSSLKAPRSFFSLSTFRGKGSESKLR